MSRLSCWLSVVLVTALAAASASACPGTFAIGLPLLFGSEEPTSPWPTPSDFRPVIDLRLPAGFDEAQDFSEPLGRQGLAQECLKVWRQLVRDGRFDLAPVVAAKAASLDPTNVDVQHAVIVSQVLRNIDEKTKRTANRVDADMATNIVPIKMPSLLENASELPTENELVAQRALKHLFPGGLLAADSACAGVCPAAPGPVADSIPARNLPAKYLAPSKSDLKTIPLTALGQPKPTNYRLAAGDVLGVHIDGVLGGQNPVVQKSDDPDDPPGVGYPIPVRDDGTISLPLLSKPLHVADRTLAEAEALIARAYTTPKQMVDLNKSRLLVSLIHPRRYAVQVLRQDSPRSAQESGSTRRQGVGVTLRLAAYKNDVLNALTQTGGLPSLDARDEVSIQRRLKDGSTRNIRIPLRVRAGDPIPFQPSDVILEDGDIVFIEGRESDDTIVIPERTPSPCGIGLNSDAGIVGSVRTVGHTAAAMDAKRVAIQTAAWLVECDRVVFMNDREMLVEGNVNLLMRQRDMSVRGGRVRMNLMDGSIQVDGNGSFTVPNRAP